MPRRNHNARRRRSWPAPQPPEPPRSVNGVNWDARAWDLYRAGLISFQATGRTVREEYTNG